MSAVLAEFPQAATAPPGVLRAPFPYFGGKSRVADLVWDRFGADIENYVEPFAGSLAVLLARPGFFGTKHPRTETINDLDCFVANFWRALEADPDGVAWWADGPVNEADLTARHLWLVNRAEFRERMKTDPDHYDVKIAGWWVWGISQWIGAGWCATTRRKLPHLGDAGKGVHRKLPHLGTAGMGVHRQLPHLGDAGKGVHRKLPHLGTAGMGVHRQLPHLGNAGTGVHRQLPHLGNAGTGLVQYLNSLADRLRGVRVSCGDWERICGPSVTFRHGTTAVFLDPPYGGDDRDGVYAEESRDVAHDVRAWAIANGGNPDLRIALCGYESPDYAMPAEWKAVAWKASGGYGSQAHDSNHARGRANALRETIWFSPACAAPQGELF